MALLIWAAAMDLKRYRICNWLIVMGLAAGFSFQVADAGWKGVGVFFINVFAPVFLCYLLFLVRALGAGDIKLFSVIGGICGIQILFQTVLWSFLVGACMALCKMSYYRTLSVRLCIFWGYLRQVMAEGRLLKYPGHVEKEAAGHPGQLEGTRHFIHFSVAIVFGYGIALWRVFHCVMGVAD